MHLHDLLTKKNANLSFSEGVSPSRLTINGELVLGIMLPAGRAHEIRIMGAADYPHFRLGLQDVGFMAAIAPAAAAIAERATVRLAFEAPSGRARREFSVGPEAPTPLFAPDIFDLPDPFAKADLVIETDRLAYDLFIGSSGRVSRDPLYRLARGRGVEIGPGPKPQILNSSTTEVIYVEEKPAEEWLATYKTGASDEAWARAGYRIGKAHELPVDDGSLDFIFSSHVIEHLYNPLGHFDHWRRKLKRGGLVLGVVPCAEGTKDFVLPQTSIEDLLAEYAGGAYSAPLSTYVRWVRHHRPHLADPAAMAEQLFQDRFSIHVHVYDSVSIGVLLQRLVRSHGFDNYRVSYKRNAKDFIFALRAG
jgi:SAM-dependent methyltransferase